MFKGGERVVIFGQNRLSDRAQKYLEISSLENALRIGPSGDLYAELRRELVEEQRRLAKEVFPEAFVEAEAKSGV